MNRGGRARHPNDTHHAVVTNDLLLTYALLLGGVTGAATARVAGAHPLVLALPVLLALGLTVLPTPESLLAAAGLTLLTVTISFCAFHEYRPLDGRPAFGLVAVIFGLIVLGALGGGLPGLAFAALIGLAAGVLSRARLDTLLHLFPLPIPFPALLAGLTGLCFVIGATLHPSAGALAGAFFLLLALVRPVHPLLPAKERTR